MDSASLCFKVESWSCGCRKSARERNDTFNRWENERCSTSLDPFLPQNIPNRNLWGIVAVGEVGLHEKCLKSLERKG